MKSDILNLLKRIVKKQDELIDSFNKWVLQVKENDLAGASETVKVSNELRKELVLLKKELDVLNRRAGIVIVKK